MARFIDEQMLTTEEVAAVFRVPKKTIDDWCLAGKIGYSKPGRGRLFPKSEVERVLQNSFRKAI